MIVAETPNPRKGRRALFLVALWKSKSFACKKQIFHRLTFGRFGKYLQLG